MEREIKFRLWNNGHFYKWGFITDEVTKKLIFRKFPEFPRDFEDIRFSSHEFIGYDKKGKEVYEGDIVKYPQGVSQNAEKDFVLVYVARSLIINNKVGVYLHWLREIRDFDTKKVIVVGNMYENPELLKDIRDSKEESIKLSKEIGQEILDEEHYPNQDGFAIPLIAQKVV